MRIAFLGSKTLGLSVLRCLVDTSPDHEWSVVHPDDSSDDRSVCLHFRNFAAERGLAFHLADGAAAEREVLVGVGSEIAFVRGWYRLIGPEILSALRKGAFGIHNSLLPRYRGGAPLVWAIMNGDSEVGASVFRFGAGMDDGDILFQVRTSVGPDATIGDVLPQIEHRLLAELPAHWARLLDGSAALAPQHHANATYGGQRRPDDGRIDWSVPAQRLHDFVRAQARPYPGAFTFLAGVRIGIERTRLDPRLYFGTPGQILQRTRDGVLVSCGDNTALEVCALRVEGETVSPHGHLNSVTLRLG